MTDKELLEFAAKAAGLPIEYRGFGCGEAQLAREVSHNSYNGITAHKPWSPLTDDGDALRLVVKLNLDINSYKGSKEVAAVQHSQRTKAYTRSIEKYSDNPYAATRRAIVRAAAEIGKEMK